MRTIVKDPVKEAVHEALAEERAVEEEASEGDGNRFSLPRLLLLVGGLAAVGYYIQRRRGKSNGGMAGDDRSPGATGRETSTSRRDPATSSVDRETGGVGMGSDSEPAGTDTEEESVSSFGSSRQSDDEPTAPGDESPGSE